MNAPASRRALDAARKAKHAWLLARIAAHEEPRKAWARARDTYYRPRYEGSTFEFRARAVPPVVHQLGRAGGDRHGGARAATGLLLLDRPQRAHSRHDCASLEAMREGIGVPVLLVTPDNLDEVVVDGPPAATRRTSPCPTSTARTTSGPT